MSDFTGPGSYEILPVKALGYSLNLWGGRVSPPGTPIRLYPREGTVNTIFEFVATGLQPNEYHIISDSSGLLVNNTNGGLPVEQVDPRKPWARWVLNAVGKGNGAYYINNADGTTQMNVRGAS